MHTQLKGSRANMQQVDDKRKKDTFVLSLAYSPDGQQIACGCMDGIVAIFDVNTGKLTNVLEGHFKPVRSISFTPGEIAGYYQLACSYAVPCSCDSKL